MRKDNQINRIVWSTGARSRNVHLARFIVEVDGATVIFQCDVTERAGLRVQVDGSAVISLRSGIIPSVGLVVQVHRWTIDERGRLGALSPTRVVVVLGIDLITAGLRAGGLGVVRAVVGWVLVLVQAVYLVRADTDGVAMAAGQPVRPIPGASTVGRTLALSSVLGLGVVLAFGLI